MSPRINDTQYDVEGNRRDVLEELELRADEMSPHQRALRVVLHMWSSLMPWLSLVGALVVGTWLARRGPGSIDGFILLCTYFLAGMPTALALYGSQQLLRRAIARRVLQKLDAPVRGALSGGETSVAFQTTRADTPATSTTNNDDDDHDHDDHDDHDHDDHDDHDETDRNR